MQKRTLTPERETRCRIGIGRDFNNLNPVFQNDFGAARYYPDSCLDNRCAVRAIDRSPSWCKVVKVMEMRS